MKARFVGEKCTNYMRSLPIVHGGVYFDVTLRRGRWYERWFADVKIVAKVHAFGHDYNIAYKDIEAFEKDWNIV